MIDLVVDSTILELVLCVTLFGSPENAGKFFHFVLRLSCLRKFNMRKLRGLRNSSQNLCFDFIYLFIFLFLAIQMDKQRFRVFVQ